MLSMVFLACNTMGYGPEACQTFIEPLPQEVAQYMTELQCQMSPQLMMSVPLWEAKKPGWKVARFTCKDMDPSAKDT